MKSTSQINRKVLRFFKQYKPLIFRNKEIIISHRKRNIDSIYLIEDGYVSQSIVTGDLEKMFINIYRPYSYFPIIYAMNNISNYYEFKAITRVKIWKAPAGDVISFIKKNTDILYDLSTRLGLGIDRLLLVINHLRFEKANVRIYNLMTMLGSRLGTTKKGYSIIDFPFSQKEIASYTGLTRETVSREFSKLERKKLIYKDDKRIFIKQKKKAITYSSIF